MSEKQDNKPSGYIGRREFLRYIGVGSSMVSSGDGKTLSFQPEGRKESPNIHLPGEQRLAGPWRFRIDEKNLGKKRLWYRDEPSDTEAKAISVVVPSVWQAYVPGLTGGIGWYFKEFVLPSAFQDRVLRLKFWAVDYFTEVWLNGMTVGNHEGGYTPFEMDITRQAKIVVENRLVVRVVDPPRPLTQRYFRIPGWEGTTDGTVDGFKFMEIPMGHQCWAEGFNFGGIWQPVELLETERVYVSDVFIEPKLNPGRIEAHVELTSREQPAIEGVVRVVVRPWKDQRNLIGQSSSSGRYSPGATMVDLHVDIPEPRVWSPEDPHLYVAEVSLEYDGRIRHQTTVRFGLREFTVQDGYFQLNGKRIFVKGGHHQGTYPVTLEVPPTRDFAYDEVRIFKEAGFNLCRLWVKPATAEFLDAADELGLMLIEEPPLSLMMDSQWLRDRSLREVREMVRRDRNRPSVVMWNMINEADPPMKYVREECQAARELDPTRLITETVGGPTHYYAPYSNLGISYLDEHPYAGGPVAEDVYEYNRTRGVAGQLCFFSEYGYGGMNDLESVLAHYGDHPLTYMEDYAAHLYLKDKRDKAFEGSESLKRIFRNTDELRETSQTIQADAIRLQTEAMRCNPCMGGYNYVQVFDSNAFELDGLVDFWREKRKKAFYVMQEANKPLLVVVRSSPMNVRSGEGVEVNVTLVNEDQVSGQKLLTVKMKSPTGSEIFSKELMIEARSWVTKLFQEMVNVEGETGRYSIEAVLWDGTRQLVKKEDFCTVIAESDLHWPSTPIIVLDPDQQIEPFLKAHNRPFKPAGTDIQEPSVILVTGSTSLWRRPEEFRKFFKLFPWVQRGCTAIFLEVLIDGPGPLTAAPIFMESYLSPFAVAHVTPFDRLESTEQTWAGQRFGAYAWGLTDLMSGVPIPGHPVFEGIPQDGMMGREYGNIVPVKRIGTDWTKSEDTGSTVQIYSATGLTPIGKGKIIITNLNLLPNLGRDALAEKMLCNLVQFAQQGLPVRMEPESSYTAESLKFQERAYQDCVTKYLIGQRRN